MTQDKPLTTTRPGQRTSHRRPKTNGQPAAHRFHPGRTRRSEQGYILLLLMLFVTIMVIAASVAAPSIAFRVKRDREEELVHRGVQYSRAIQRYVKKTGRYPSRLEDLENTNNMRFLRRRYKDPITGKDFKLLHVGEVQLTGTAGIAGAASLLGKNGAAAGGAALAAAGAAMGSATGQALMGATPAPAQNLGSDASAGAADDANSTKPERRRLFEVRLELIEWRDWQQPIVQRGFWRRAHCGRGQHQQSDLDSRI